MIQVPKQEAKHNHINKKLAIFFLLLYFLVPAALIVPLYERVNQVEQLEQQDQIQQLNNEEASVKEVCDKATKKSARSEKATCSG